MPTRDKEKREYCASNSRTIVSTMVLAFVIPVVIMAFALRKVQIWPGGEFNIYTYDMRALFSPIISSLRYLGNNDSSVFFSFFGALGNNALLNYSSFIMDPMMWISVFFPLEQMPSVVYFITLAKIGLCGVSASVFFFFGIKGNKHSVVVLIFSICYALMSYNIMFSQIILFYNVIALAPIILLGIEQMIEGKRGGIYILCMTLSLYYSVQLSYMIGIFAVLYMIWRLAEMHENRIIVVVRFLICNILCAGMYMPVFLPLMFNLSSGRMQTQNYRAGTLLYYSLWDVLKQFMSCSYDTIESGGLPTIFCGTFIPLFALLAFVLPYKSLLCRIISVVIFLFFIASFCIVPLNQFWHGFNEPNSFPVRYSFLFCFFILILAYHSVCFLLEKNGVPEALLKVIYGVSLLVTCTEMYLNAGFILNSLNIENNYEINSMYQLHLKSVKAAMDNIEDDDFYRIGRDMTYSHNDGMLFGYNGIGYFSSMFERNTMEFFKRLGYSQYEHSLQDTGGTPLAEALLGVRYKILFVPECFGYYEKIFKYGGVELQYNQNALPLGVLIGLQNYNTEDREELTKSIEDHNSFAFQECLLSELRGERVHAFEEINYELEEIDSEDFERHVKMSFIAKNDKPVWIYCRDDHDGEIVIAPNRNSTVEVSDLTGSPTGDQVDSAFLKVNGSDKYPFVDRVSTLCMYLGKFKEGDLVEIEAACVNAFDDPWIVYYNEDECNVALQEIKKTPLNITEHRNGVIKGKVSVEDNRNLMVLTLPFMKGYRVLVDGNRTDYGSYSDALLAFEMEPGDHTIEISFIPYGLIPGAVIGLVFFAMTILYLRLIGKKQRTQGLESCSCHCEE